MDLLVKVKCMLGNYAMSSGFSDSTTCRCTMYEQSLRLGFWGALHCYITGCTIGVFILNMSGSISRRFDKMEFFCACWKWLDIHSENDIYNM